MHVAMQGATLLKKLGTAKVSMEMRMYVAMLDQAWLMHAGAKEVRRWGRPQEEIGWKNQG